MIEVKWDCSAEQLLSEWLLNKEQSASLRIYTSGEESILRKLDYWLLRRLRYITGARIEIKDGYVDIHLPPLQVEGVYIILKALEKMHSTNEGYNDDDIRSLSDLGDEGFLLPKRKRMPDPYFFIGGLNLFVTDKFVVWFDGVWSRPANIVKQFAEFSLKYKSILLFGIDDVGYRDVHLIQIFREGRYLEDLPIYHAEGWKTKPLVEEPPPIICDLAIGLSFEYRFLDNGREKPTQEIINQILSLPEGGNDVRDEEG